MSDSKSPEKKKPCRGLSISKTKKNAFEKPSPSKASPILAYFNNAPPAKFACPICGELVPRYGMNKHLDEVCQKDQQGHDDDVILVEPVTTPLTSRLSDMHPNNCINSPSANKAWDAGMSSTSPNRSIFEENTKRQTSPYFGKRTVDDNMYVQAVNTVELQSLSSKLSKRKQKPKSELSESSAKTSPIQALRNEADNSINSDNVSSQKENHQFENNMRLGRGAKKHTTVTENLDIVNLVSECEKAGSRPDCDQPTTINSFDMMLRSKKEHAEVLMPQKTKRPWKLRAVAKVSKRQGKTVLCTEHCRMEPGDEFPTELPLMTEDVASTVSGMESVNQMENCYKDGAMEVLPVEDLNDLDDEIIQGLLEPFEEKDLKNEICENVNSATESLANPSGNPYYLRNFLMVLQTIMDNEDDMSLFNEQDTSILSTFLKLSAGSQKLYVRLFQRKLNWIKVNKIEYSEIAADLSPMIEELVHAGFIQTEAELLEVPEVLDLLPAPDLKTLAKIFRLDNPNGQKQHLIESFLRLAKQRSIFSFGKNQSGIGAVILKRAKELAGRCVRVCRAPRNVFSRVLMLFSLTDSMEMEEAASGGQAQLSTVLMVNMGRTTFPTYTVNRQTKIFQDREDLIGYETAMHTLIDIAAAMGNGKWEEANQLYQCAKESWNELKDHPNNGHHEKLPVYLRCFTVGWIYARIRSRGVEILQRLHLYEEAVNELKSLLSQTVYCPDSRGRWWDRLALNLHQHLKRTEKAVGHVLEGLADPFVRTGHQLALYHRALRIRDSASCKKFRHLFENMPEIQVEDVAHVTIKGKMFPHSGTGKSVFLLQEVCDDEDGEDISVSTVMCSVEDLALAHYRQQGYDQGIHGEGSTFSTLYSLLMWDIIFMDGVPDVFRNSYQALPLDLYTDNFFENRRGAIETRLELLKEANRETLEQMIADVWNSEEGKAAALVNWERFTSLQQAQSLVACFGGLFLSGVCMRLSKDLRHCRGGLPDLVVWNTKTNSFKVVEVKGPNDRLSHKQMIWLDELRKLGADVEVCHVVAIGAKSLHIG